MFAGLHRKSCPRFVVRTHHNRVDRMDAHGAIDMDDDERSKRTRAQATAQPPAVQPQVWPSQASLYAQGLENRAQTLPTTFAMDGAQWRAQHFDSADLSGSTLRQRQAEARKALLRTAQPSKQ